MRALSLVLLIVVASGGDRGAARASDITQSCFPGFCIESEDAFTTIARNPERGHYRFMVSRVQEVLFVQAGAQVPFPHCPRGCLVEEVAGEKRSRVIRTGQIVGRLIGPLAPCSGDRPFHVHLYGYAEEIDPLRFAVERNCR